MPGKRKRGAGWEDEIKAAEERDRVSQEDKRVADAIRTAAAADSKKRTGGGLRRKRCKTCGCLPKKGSGFLDEFRDWVLDGNYWVNRKTGEKRAVAVVKKAGKLGFKIGSWEI